LSPGIVRGFFASPLLERGGGASRLVGASRRTNFVRLIAARKLVEIAGTIEPVQDGRIFIELRRAGTLTWAPNPQTAAFWSEDEALCSR
jgi:hypothetical protein